MTKSIDDRLRSCVEDVIRNAVLYHEAYYQADTFRGPSLYFHRRSVEMVRDGLTIQRLECIYATLASWGMHRMGKGGSKMRPFEEFRESVLARADDVTKASAIDPAALGEDGWQSLKTLFTSIRVMATDTLLVGNSKVMAHLIPEVVPPIDREYTLQHLLGNKNIRNNPEQEWSTLKLLLECFFLPVVRDPGFQREAHTWLQNQAVYPWDTSMMKVVDNLLIGARKKHARERD